MIRAAWSCRRIDGRHGVARRRGFHRLIIVGRGSTHARRADTAIHLNDCRSYNPSRIPQRFARSGMMRAISRPSSVAVSTPVQ
jgi:hypothetical protein